MPPTGRRHLARRPRLPGRRIAAVLVQRETPPQPVARKEVRMSAQLDLRLDPHDHTLRVQLVTADSELIGKEATLSIAVHFEVNDSRAINKQHEVYRETFTLSGSTHTLHIPADKISTFSYAGKMINIIPRAHVRIDDGIIFDTKISEEVEIALGWKPRIGTGAHRLVEPEDAFCFATNFQAIPLKNKIAFLMLAGIAGVLIAINTIVGVHDQLVPEHQTQVELWVIACNMEHGQYTRGSGTNIRTISFKEPVNGVTLFRTNVAHIPRRAAIEDYIDGVVKFEPMFAKLYPPQQPISSHGLSVHLEVQLRVDDLVDQELVIPETQLND